MTNHQYSVVGFLLPKNRTNERRAEMERLTIQDEKIEGGLRRAVIDAREVRKEAMTIYWALKKYEDTGLTPEQIRELKERDTAKMPRYEGPAYSVRHPKSEYDNTQNVSARKER